MARSRTPGYLCWILAILLHGDVLVILLLVLGGDEAKEPAPENPDFQCALVKPPPVVQVDLRRDGQFGRWPVTCDHQYRTLEIAEDQLGDGLRCQKCGWPWWVIRAWPQD